MGLLWLRGTCVAVQALVILGRTLKMGGGEHKYQKLSEETPVIQDSATWSPKINQNGAPKETKKSLYDRANFLKVARVI